MLNCTQAAEKAGISWRRLYRLVDRHYVEPAKAGPHRLVFTECDAAVAGIAASLLDRGVPSYAVHDVARRLAQHTEVEALRSHAHQIQVAHDGGLWSVFDFALDASAESDLALLTEAGAVDRVEPALPA